MARNKGNLENVFCQRALSCGNFFIISYYLVLPLRENSETKKMESATKPVDLEDCGKRWEKRWLILRVLCEEELEF